MKVASNPLQLHFVPSYFSYEWQIRQRVGVNYAFITGTYNFMGCLGGLQQKDMARPEERKRVRQSERDLIDSSSASLWVPQNLEGPGGG